MILAILVIRFQGILSPGLIVNNRHLLLNRIVIKKIRVLSDIIRINHFQIKTLFKKLLVKPHMSKLYELNMKLSKKWISFPSIYAQLTRSPLHLRNTQHCKMEHRPQVRTSPLYKVHPNMNIIMRNAMITLFYTLWSLAQSQITNNNNSNHSHQIGVPMANA